MFDHPEIYRQGFGVMVRCKRTSELHVVPNVSAKLVDDSLSRLIGRQG